MAGMEQLEIHSKSYLVRWVNVKAEHTISWSIRPDKKSINFGIFKHPGTGQAPTPNLPSSTFEPPPTPALRPEDAPQESHSSKNASSTATEKLKSIGLKPVSWYGTCEANRVSTGTYDVPKNEGAMYALVFDNTFAKSFAKSATFVLLTYPTGSPPQSNHHIHHIQGGSSESTGWSNSATQRAADDFRNRRQGENESRPGSNFFTGILHKKRRKKNQGWARRFFSLDYTSSTLSYYQNRRTQVVRGAVPLSMAAIGANSQTRQISIDSGAEIWHLKAGNQKDFDAWTQALELARSYASPATPASTIRAEINRGIASSSVRSDPEEERDWVKVERLVAKVKGSRDAAKSLAVDTDPKYLSRTHTHTPIDPALKRTDSAEISAASSTSGSPAEQSLPSGYFAEGDRKPFWKRKTNTDRPVPGMYRSVSATPSTQSARPNAPAPIRTSSFGKPLESHSEEESLHDRCLSLLRDLDSIVSEFSHVVTERKQRRTPVVPPPTSRQSLDTQGDDEFFDAEGGTSSQLLDIHHETEEEGEEVDRGFASDEDSASASDVDEPSVPGQHGVGSGKANPAYPPKPKSLSPLPAQWVKRRTTVTAPIGAPPSLVSFMRKNVGKDLSTISMPVTANEPISALQRFAEAVEYSSLLDEAANKSRSSIERLIYITAFAVSNLSSIRIKERAIRKPFNPMLGETFELVREDRGFRFLAEKVSHRPVRMAYQVESEQWTLTQSPLPTQKFWGKSAELITEGKSRVILHSTGDRYSWAPGSSFLRNIIAGEKYVEPVGNMTIVNEGTGEKAVVTFKTKGMFSGRSEDVAVQTYDSYGDEQALGLVGKWTSSLTVVDNGNSRANEPPIWSIAELVPDAAKRYGFTTFAASLNEVTPIEKGRLPPTDSRLRPDQRAAEDGDFDEAEVLKGKLEEAQRNRRKVMEDEGRSWTPRWFEKVEGGDGSGEEVWVAKAGQNNYWEKRRNSEWGEVEKIFDL
ncbi:Oxysterol-binding protein-domain-containing protein [Usnea florida]